MFRAILCPSSGARGYYTDGRCLWYLVLWFSGCRYGVGLKVMCPVCRQQPFRHKIYGKSKHILWSVTYVEIKCQLDVTDDIYCRFYCMLNIFRAILCPTSGAREYYTDGRCLWYLVLWFSGCRYDVELKVMCPVCRQQPANRTHNLIRNNDDARSESLQVQ